MKLLNILAEPIYILDGEHKRCTNCYHYQDGICLYWIEWAKKKCCYWEK